MVSSVENKAVRDYFPANLEVKQNLAYRRVFWWPEEGKNYSEQKNGPGDQVNIKVCSQSLTSHAIQPSHSWKG